MGGGAFDVCRSKPRHAVVATIILLSMVAAGWWSGSRQQEAYVVRGSISNYTAPDGAQYMRYYPSLGGRVADYRDVDIVMVSDARSDTTDMTLFSLHSRARRIPDESSALYDGTSWDYWELYKVMDDFWSHVDCRRGSKFIAKIDDDVLVTNNEANEILWAMDTHNMEYGGATFESWIGDLYVLGYFQVVRRSTVCKIKECYRNSRTVAEDARLAECMKVVPAANKMGVWTDVVHKRRLIGRTFVCVRCDLKHEALVEKYIAENPAINEGHSQNGQGW